jgi:glycosyltransferase involved in cell wall biosynthesis
MAEPLNRSLFVGLSLGRNTGGPYKTILQFQEALNGQVISLSNRNTEVVAGDGVRHLFAGPSRLEQYLLYLRRKERAELYEDINRASHVQCHILFRYHVHCIWKAHITTGKPYWVVPHGCLDPYVFTYNRRLKLLWMLLIGRSFLKHASHVIFSSRREYDKAKVWLQRDNARIVRWPVELPDTIRNASARRALRERLKIAPDARVLLWVGRLHPMKRPIEAAEIFARVSDPKMHLVYLGADEVGLGPRLRAIGRECPHKNVHWLGTAYGRDKDEIFCGGDGFWSYSVRENFGHAAAEALATGLPLILSPGNDLVLELQADQVRPGWLVADDKTETVASALLEWGRADEALISSLGMIGREWACKELSFARFKKNLEQLEDQKIIVPPNLQIPPQLDSLWEAQLKTITRWMP